jgi:DNA repair exonuclease SbcCD nuclease subunit
MKVAFFGDCHINTRNPGLRIDDYCLTIIKKLHEGLTWCREQSDIDGIVLLGDLFHIREPGGRARNLTIKILKKHLDLGGQKIYSCVGNHDTSNDHHTLERSALWSLHESGLIKICDYIPKLKIALKHHTVTVDNEIKNDGLSHDKALIWATHASIFPSQFGRFVDFNQINITGPCKLIVTGHIHDSYRVKREDGIKLINPGSIAREKLDDKTPEHKVRFLVVDYDDKKINSAKYIPLKYKPFEEVFDIDKAEHRKLLSKNIEEIVIHDNSREYEGLTPNAIVELAKSEDFSDGVIKIIHKYIGEAHAKL